MSAANDSSAAEPASKRGYVGRTIWPATTAVVATGLVFVPFLLRNPSTTEAAPVIWLVALILAAPVAAYFTSRRIGPPSNVAYYLLVGLPQLPLLLSLSAFSIWLDVQRGHLLAGSGEESMSYGIGTIAAFIAGVILLLLVAVGAMLGGRRRVAVGRS